MKETAERLRKAGFPVDLGRLKIETKSQEACFEDLDRQQDLFCGPKHYETVAALDGAFGAPGDAGALRAEAVRSSLSSLLAYYHPDRHAIVLIDSEMNRLLGARHYLAHELAHAWRDEVSGLAALLGSGSRTWEETNISSCLLEGEAQVVALSASLAEKGKDLGSVDPDRFEYPLARFLGREAFALPYEAGAKFVLLACREGGVGALKRLWDERPPSTEQILHPEKRGRDAPRAVGLPPWPAVLGEGDLVREDVVGEMALYEFLRSQGLERSKAWVAAAGWDGDRLRVVWRKMWRPAVQWRIVFDREEDARQLEKALRSAAGGTEDEEETLDAPLVQVRGAAVDLVFAGPEEFDRKLLSSLEAFPLPQAANPSDAESTAAMEEAWLADQGNVMRFEPGTLVLPRHRLRIPVPPGWTAEDVNGIPMLFAPPPSLLYRDNLDVQRGPREADQDVDDLLEGCRAVLEKLPTVSLDVAEKRIVDGREVGYIRFHGRVPGQELSLRSLRLLYPDRGAQVVITATVLEERWAETEPVLEKVFAGISFMEGTASGPATRAAR
ncbi:MAG TPA: hypothetical protein VKF62_06445 [Planctomycetota bacterium]|nr:hypothetical protein [Planctomycetota bacterium]